MLDTLGKVHGVERAGVEYPDDGALSCSIGKADSLGCSIVDGE